MYDPGTGRFTQEDPIGLAGGMNLYGFAGGDPVNFSDPLGLMAMDVKITDEQTQAEVDALRKRSKTFDEAYRKLDEDHSVLVTMGRQSTVGCGGSGGCAERLGTNAKGQRLFNVRLDNQGIISDYFVQKGYGGADSFTVMAHEFYGHVVPWAAGSSCGDTFPGTTGACSVRRENVI